MREQFGSRRCSGGMPPARREHIIRRTSRQIHSSWYGQAGAARYKASPPAFVAKTGRWTSARACRGAHSLTRGGAASGNTARQLDHGSCIKNCEVDEVEAPGESVSSQTVAGVGGHAPDAKPPAS